MRKNLIDNIILQNTTKETYNVFHLPNYSSSLSSLDSDSTPKRSNVSFNHPVLYFDEDDYEEVRLKQLSHLITSIFIFPWIVLHQMMKKKHLKKIFWYLEKK